MDPRVVAREVVLVLAGVGAVALSLRYRAVWSAVPGAKALLLAAGLTFTSWCVGLAEDLGVPDAAHDVLHGLEQALLVLSALVLCAWATRLPAGTEP